VPALGSGAARPSEEIINDNFKWEKHRKIRFHGKMESQNKIEINPHNFMRKKST
jgi:hypothetical protein